MKPIRINAAPPIAKRPKCPQCSRALRPQWRTVKSERLHNAQGFETRETLEFAGHYRGYGAFDTQRCAVEFANAAHVAALQITAAFDKGGELIAMALHHAGAEELRRVHRELRRYATNEAHPPIAQFETTPAARWLERGQFVRLEDL